MPVPTGRKPLRSLRIHLARGVAGISLLTVSAAALSWTLGGVYVPPVISTPSPEAWRSAALYFPTDRQEVAILMADEPIILRGIYAPSDEGAPLVVHFAGSGVTLRSALTPLQGQHQFGELAGLGFASLAVDYRGAGTSTGRPDPTALGRDAMAIWERALEMVNGDASRIILRGCSLGSIAIAELLQQGVEPGGIVMIAPVEASNVALNYGLAWLPGPTAWLAAPFLRDFAGARTIDELVRATAPRLALCHPDDELLGRDAFVDLTVRLGQAGGQAHHPNDIPGLLPIFGPVVEFMPHHVGLSALAMEVSPAEETFLCETYSDLLHGRERLAALLNKLTPSVLAKLSRTEGAMARLEGLTSRNRFLVPNIAAAAACALTDEEFASSDGWLPIPNSPSRATHLEQRWNLPFDQLVEVLSLEDEAGRIPAEARQLAEWAVGCISRGNSQARAPRNRVLTLAAVSLDTKSHGEASRRPASPSPWFFERDEKGRISYTDQENGIDAARAWQMAKLIRLLSESSTAGDDALAARLERCLLRTVGHLPRKDRP